MKQLISFFGFIFLLVSFSSCTKEEVMPPQEAGFTRTLVFPKQGNIIKQAQYKSSDPIEARAGFEEGEFYIFFGVTPSAVSYFGDAVLLTVNAAQFKANPIQQYSFSAPGARLTRARYTYSFNNRFGDTWGTVTDSKVGVVFEGHLNITHYNPKKKLVSGEYVIRANDLITDPTRQGTIGSPIDPADQCKLMITGSFNHVRVQ